MFTKTAIVLVVNALLRMAIVITLSTGIFGQFRNQLTDLSPPDCIQSNGQRGKCYRYDECGKFYRKKVNFDICEITLEYVTLVCCDELPSSRYNVFRSDNNWTPNGVFKNVDFECGVRIANKDVLEAMANPVDPNDEGQALVQALAFLASRDSAHPWMAAVWFKNVQICGGSIINRRTILTSAHCLAFSRDPMDYTITLGSIYLSQGRRFKVNRVIIHPEYRSTRLYNDVALIVLDNPLRFDWRVNPVCLSSGYMGESMLKAQKATVIGFGNKPSPGRSLQEVSIPLISSSDCSSIYSNYRQLPFGWTNELICAGYLQGGKDSCSGDSGGPITIKYNSKIMQIGIVNSGTGCGLPGFPGIYTSVSFHYRWIQENAVW